MNLIYIYICNVYINIYIDAHSMCIRTCLSICLFVRLSLRSSVNMKILRTNREASAEVWGLRTHTLHQDGQWDSAKLALASLDRCNFQADK